jgi:uncharacterized protein (DUF1800 family)
MIDRRRLLQASVAAFGGASPVLSAFAAPARDGLDPTSQAAHVLNRLGFGPRPGDLATVSRDPQAWIEQQLAPQQLALPASLTARLNETQFTGGDPIAPVREFIALLQDRRAAAKFAQSAQTMQPGQAVAAAPGAAAQAGQPNGPVAQYVRGFQLPAIESRLFRALESPRQLQEVMVDFWFNHFNVYQNKNFMRVLVGHYEHSAIRPHALGRFRDLLGATAHHPAMLYYLDNWTSVGPQGEARGRGLNENYARELMELHTLGVDAGYSQQDVTQLARMLTGWTIVPPRRPLAAGPLARMARSGNGGAMPGFLFNERMHDAGEKTWLGHRIAPNGQAEGEYALDVLASHPATAHHIAYKLAQYFVSDQPDPALVERLASEFQKHDGQIVPVLRALFASDAFWSPANRGAKFKTPYHYALSTLRAGGYTVDGAQPLANFLGAEGMPLFGCLTPDGYKNTEAAWLNADGVGKRFDFAAQVANHRLGREQLTGGLAARDLMDQLGPLVTPATRELVARKSEEAPVVAVAMVLAGPGMMRR